MDKRQQKALRITGMVTTYETPEGTKFIFPEKYDKQKQRLTPEKAVELYGKVPKKL